MGARIEIVMLPLMIAPSSVAPLVGARIEIAVGQCVGNIRYLVAPLVGARIEIVIADLTSGGTWVAPLAGARIEI